MKIVIIPLIFGQLSSIQLLNGAEMLKTQRTIGLIFTFHQQTFEGLITIVHHCKKETIVLVL